MAHSEAPSPSPRRRGRPRLHDERLQLNLRFTNAEQIECLDALAGTWGVGRSEAVRRAVAESLAREQGTAAAVAAQPAEPTPQLASDDLVLLDVLSAVWGTDPAAVLGQLLREAYAREAAPVAQVPTPDAPPPPAPAEDPGTLRCTDCGATAPDGAPGWQVDYVQGEPREAPRRRARCPEHTDAARARRARRTTEEQAQQPQTRGGK